MKAKMTLLPKNTYPKTIIPKGKQIQTRYFSLKKSKLHNSKIDRYDIKTIALEAIKSLNLCNTFLS